MKFTLQYQGPLPSNGSRADKQVIRQQLHGQLQDLWSHPRLEHAASKLLAPARVGSTDPHRLSSVRDVGGHQFAFLVAERLSATAGLQVDFLRPEPPGRIMQTGDIDNRIKTLFDGLSIPQQANMLPAQYTPEPTDAPLYCLLEDDKLVTGLEVQTYEWLASRDRNPSDVLLVIHVETRLSGPMTELNEGFA